MLVNWHHMNRSKTEQTYLWTDDSRLAHGKPTDLRWWVLNQIILCKIFMHKRQFMGIFGLFFFNSEILVVRIVIYEIKSSKYGHHWSVIDRTLTLVIGILILNWSVPFTPVFSKRENKVKWSLGRQRDQLCEFLMDAKISTILATSNKTTSIAKSLEDSDT